MITVKWQQRRSNLLNINLYQVNYKNILDLNCWLTIISKMLTKFIAFLVTNRLHTMNLTLTGRELTTLKKTLATIFKISACKITFIYSVNPIQTGLFGNFVELGAAENARALCLLISRQLLALESSFKFV